MDSVSHSFTAPIWLYDGKGAWHFVTLPKDVAHAIRFHAPLARGFMPIAVRARIGSTEWKTSVFPDSKSGSLLLAVKAEVRKKEKLVAGDVVTVTLALQ
ncbi:MAG: DUF1905 domain-containing protein [Hyphomicrobiales bacterium]